MDFEKDIITLRKGLSTQEAEHVTERAAADAVVASLRAEGADPFTPENFAKVDEAYKRADAMKAAIAETKVRLQRVLDIAGEKADERRPSVERSEARTVAARFIQSEEYRALRSSGRLTMSGTSVSMAPVEICTREEAIQGLRTRTTVDNTSGSGGGTIWSDRLENLIVAVPQRMVKFLDVITVGQTDTDTIEWTKETTHTDNAAETAFGTSAPESAYGWTKQSTTVKRLPHFIPVTKGAMADSAQLTTLLQSNLMGGLRRRLESQLVVGDGTGENLTGFTTVAGVGSIARGATTRFDAAHQAITNVRLNLFDEPEEICLHPTDFETILLEKDANGNYVHGRAAAEGSIQTIWGLTPVVSAVFPQGTAWVGDFDYLYLWLREGISLAASDSHSTFFIQGLVALLAELRAGAALIQPKALCKVTGW